MLRPVVGAEGAAVRLQKAGYCRYRIADGPATGTLIERSTNVRRYPCFRWTVIEGVQPGGIAGWTLRGLAEACERFAARRLSA